MTMTGPQEVPGRPRQKGTAAVTAAHQGGRCFVEVSTDPSLGDKRIAVERKLVIRRSVGGIHSSY